MKSLHKLGKSLMLPVACLPICGILMGIGYALSPHALQGGDIQGAAAIVGFFLIKAGGALLNHMSWLFAVGVAVGMSDDRDGAAALAGLVSWLTITSLLDPDTIQKLSGTSANLAFSSIQNQFIGIFAGLIGSGCYNRFKDTKLPDALAFFSGKRAVIIVTALLSLLSAVILFFLWPFVFNILVKIGHSILRMGAVGAGLYVFLNRLLIPIGLHHALNAVFWFDVVGIGDLTHFWSGVAQPYGTGMYMTGFFPFMMFGLPAAALAMYHTAYPSRKNVAAGLLLSAAICSFLCGVTEPLEFAFMFLAPGLYLIHAALSGITAGITVALGMRAGFAFSAGLTDLIFSTRVPVAQKLWLIVPIGIVTAVIYYTIFRFVIVRFHLKTPGREEEQPEVKVLVPATDYTTIARTILEGVGGKENIASVDHCITRLRLEVRDQTQIDERKIKTANIVGILRPNKNSVQIIIGTQVQFVAESFEKLL